MYKRQQIFKGLGDESAFFWGARQTGKSTLLKSLYPDSLYIDLLLSDVFLPMQTRPSLLREAVIQADKRCQPVIIDEIQRIPILLNEVHWLMTNHGTRFILSGSSPRNILRSGIHLLGGRALRYELYPLVYPEITDFNLIRALNYGLLPRHYLSTTTQKLLAAYIGSYLRDEIMSEARIRNITAFTRFLEAAAFSNGEVVNFTNIASDCGVSSPSVKEYFNILEDTLTGRFLPSFQKKAKRRVIAAPKFYYFDVGIANYLLKRKDIVPGSEAFGRAFEHYIYQEIYAHSKYSELNYNINYWRTASQLEVDFVLGDGEVAIEVKGTEMAHPRHLNGLKNFDDEHHPKKLFLVTNDTFARRIGNVDILPWNVFLDMLWGGQIIT
ncbi:MAG: hypothetical protein BWY70_00221 [Bacteroidetes bacterium ADurb.Bin408]|nr:MAG: hypothetical protein BWY70_00221 [Bacteroidetes bacterium ADurb.Bin408]